jgi:transcriptional regulator with XRE-family HTH domain
MSKEDEIRRREFGRRLQKELNARGWTQSELARRIARLLLPNFRIGRDNVSKWVRGRALPLPPALEAICKVLEIETSDLLPERATPIPEPDDHSACKEALEEAHRERDEARKEAAICREEARKEREEVRKEREELRKERAFYQEKLQEHIKHLTALIPVYGPELVNTTSEDWPRR